MRIDPVATVASLKKQTALQNEIESQFSKAINPLIKETDDRLSMIYRQSTLDTTAMRDIFYNPLDGLNTKAKQVLFPLADGLEKKSRALFEDQGYEFSSPATEFFQSVTARSLALFADWFLSTASRSFIEGRSFGLPLEVRGKGYYYSNGVRVYLRYAQKRTAGQTRFKLWKAKSRGIARQSFDVNRIFKEELAGVLKERGLDVADALDFVEQAKPKPTYTLLGKTAEEATRQPNTYIVSTQGRELTLPLITMEDF